MSASFNQTPSVPSEIQNAAESGQLVVFVGAGVSRLVRCPSWDQFADAVLDQLAPVGVDYFELTQLKAIPDPKKRLSIAKIVAAKHGLPIDYGSVLRVKLEAGNVYDQLNVFDSAFVTTNYDKYLAPVSRRKELEENWRFYRSEDLLRAKLDVNGNVLHLHGCVDAPDSMIMTTRDYLEHYGRPEVQKFLQYLFESKTVLFLGYGLDELDILEYALRRGGVRGHTSSPATIRRFVLLGFFTPDRNMYDLLHNYYLESFETAIIPFSKDHKNYHQQVDILSEWARTLRFSPLPLSGEVAALEEEIRG
jgi:hypothetical protein